MNELVERPFTYPVEPSKKRVSRDVPAPTHLHSPHPFGYIPEIVEVCVGVEGGRLDDGASRGALQGPLESWLLLSGKVEVKVCSSQSRHCCLGQRRGHCRRHCMGHGWGHCLGHDHSELTTAWTPFHACPGSALCALRCAHCTNGPHRYH